MFQSIISGVSDDDFGIRGMFSPQPDDFDQLSGRKRKFLPPCEMMEFYRTVPELVLKPVEPVCTVQKYIKSTTLADKLLQDCFADFFKNKHIVVWLDNDQAIGYPEGLSLIFPQLCKLFKITQIVSQYETVIKLKGLTVRLLARLFMGTSYLRPSVLNMFDQLAAIRQFYDKIDVVMYTRAGHGISNFPIKYSWLEIIRAAVEIAVFANKSQITDLSNTKLSTQEYDKITAIQERRSPKNNIYTHCVSSRDIKSHYGLSSDDNEHKNTKLAKKMCGIPDDARGIFIDDKIHEIEPDTTVDLKSVPPYNCVPSKFEIIENIVGEFREEFSNLSSEVAFEDILQIFRSEYDQDVKNVKVLKTDDYTIGSEVYDNLPKYLYECVNNSS